jgi:hypothetical protein
MTARRDTPTGFTSKQDQLIRQNARLIDETVPRGQFVTAETAETELPRVGVPVSVLKQFARANLVERVDTVGADGSTGRIWRLPGRAHDRAEDYATAQSSPCGCGHTRFTNLGDGKFTCSEPDDVCDVRVTRSELDI